MIALTCSAGGHLSEMRELEEWYCRFPHFFITFERTDTRSLAKYENVFFIPRPARNPIITIRAFVRAWHILRVERPKIVISTGADVTVPVCLAAFLQGIPIIFIESFCRVTSPSITGRIVSKLTRNVAYQWKSLKKFYPCGTYIGNIFADKERIQ